MKHDLIVKPEMKRFSKTCRPQSRPTHFTNLQNRYCDIIGMRLQFLFKNSYA